MTVSLRTRLYLTAAAILAVSIAVSAELSRRATLFEVRELPAEPIARADVAGAVARLQAAIDGGSGMTNALEEFRQQTRRGFLVADAQERVTATSNPGFAGARASAMPNGSGYMGVTLRFPTGGQATVPNAPAFDVRIAGAPARMFVLPNPGVSPQRGRPWVLGVTATVIVALALMYGLARRILRPIGALTDAARRMADGDLTVRVDARDEDEIGGLARAFNSMAARLDENERLRRQMVGDVAHELRSPVTNLRCLLEGVQDGLQRADASTIATLYDETMFLQRLIADLQDLALAEAGSLALQIRPIDAHDVIRRAVLLTEAVSSRPPITIDASGPLLVLADSERLEQVLRNLLTNAQQHTPADGRVHVRAARRGDCMEIEVADSGSGIAPEHLQHVFDRFYRTDTSRSRRTGGAGLGLAIVRQLAIAQGGAVTAASDGPGRGATFRLTLRAV